MTNNRTAALVLSDGTFTCTESLPVKVLTNIKLCMFVKVFLDLDVAHDYNLYNLFTIKDNTGRFIEFCKCLLECGVMTESLDMKALI